MTTGYYIPYLPHLQLMEGSPLTIFCCNCGVAIPLDIAVEKCKESRGNVNELVTLIDALLTPHIHTDVIRYRSADGEFSPIVRMVGGNRD